jgi:L-rhamnose-H+ transport protein
MHVEKCFTGAPRGPILARPREALDTKGRTLMAPNPFLGVFLHGVGGLAAGSFYVPFRRVKQWAWESYWLVGGVFSWIIAPWVVALLACPDLIAVLRASPAENIFWTYAFGILWGIGGLTFGLSMRYLGLSLGYALSLGFCATFGTIIPAWYDGKILDLVRKTSGEITLGGIVVCLAGIAVCGLAGRRKEREMSAEEKQAAIREFNFVKGVWVAVFAGIMSACMALGFRAGKPIADIAATSGMPDICKNWPLLVVVLAGGFTTNFIWCVILNLKNKSHGDYVSGPAGRLALNYLFSALAGVVWYGQFFFYGMGTTKMGRYDFTSWSIHMAFIIVFSNLWGIYLKEWKGTGRLTHAVVWAGIVILVLSTIVIGYGNYVAALEKVGQ